MPYPPSANHQTLIHKSRIRSLTCRNDNPRRIEPNEVPSEVLQLRAAVRDAVELLLDEAGEVVQRHAVEVRHAHDDLERVAQASSAGGGDGGREA